MTKILTIAENVTNPFGEMVNVEVEDQAQGFAMGSRFRGLVGFSFLE